MKWPKILSSVCVVDCFLILAILSRHTFADEHQQDDRQVTPDEEDEAFYPKQEVMEPLFAKYPYQEYIQVRKVITVEHVPPKGSSMESSDSAPKIQATRKTSGNSLISPVPSASNIPVGINHMTVYHPGYAQPTEGQQNLQSHASNQQGHHFRDPGLREEIFEKKKQEVYEERGYGDSAYDHSSHGKYHQDQGGYHQRHHPHPSYQEESGTSAAASTGVKHLSPGRRHQERGIRLKNKATARNNNKNKSKVNNKGDLSPAVAASRTRQRQAVEPPAVHPMLAAGSSSDLLKYASDHLHDQRGTRLGFYQSRAHVRCPEVVDFDLGSKSQGMGDAGPVGKNKRRLHGLGAKIDCFKNKYFGSATQMLPRAIFPPPEISAKTLIRMGSMQDFLKEFRNEFHGL